jgi:GntR family transcriptional regulator, arabinose operon transcriptional repressor
MEKFKHHQIYKELRQAIVSGDYTEGQRLPSEAELVARFSTSRPTVARALKELQHQGLIERRAGSGTYVSVPTKIDSDLFGMLIPNLGETEIFEPICREMSRSTQTASHALLWANTTSQARTKEDQAEQLCEQYIRRKVSGVFFAPIELTPNKDKVNQRIAEALEKARIPVILLDRCFFGFPRRSNFDLVGIDNYRASYVLTQHLLDLGWRKIAFFARENSAPTVDARIRGYQDALRNRAIEPDSNWVCWGEPSDSQFVKLALERFEPEAIVCANDDTAGNLMHTLDEAGMKIPADVRIAAFDDVKYAKLLRVPLTTVHQPCHHIGAAAVKAMLERIAHPDMPARDILLDFKLIVRESCGANLRRNGRQAQTE